MDYAALSALVSGHVQARAIQVALKLGLFEALAQGERDAAQLASAIRGDQRATMILANAMVALGLFETSAGRYRLAEIARRHLIESSDEFLGGMIAFDEAIFPLWARLEESVRSGAPVRTPDMFQSRREDTERFIRAMDSLVRARGDARYLASILDLSNVEVMIDVGGGPGTYLMEFVNRWPRMRGVVCDLPATLAVAREMLAERGAIAQERIELAAFDYHRDEIPVRCDAILLSNIIHSEPEQVNQSLAHKCFRALNPGGRLIIKDHILNAELTEPAAGVLFSLYLLMTTNGRDYSFDEARVWLAEAGFVDIAQQRLPSPPFSSSLMFARRL
ncbi:MAG TPA: methyltransferase [Candidatus Binataceae bacterium]|nr:methyltransferase [Candidatus Binataceae bacterium]